MKKILILFVSCILFLVSSVVHAESCSSSCPDGDLDKCIAECNKLVNISISATKPHEQKAQELQATIDNIESNVETLTNLIGRRKDQINAQEGKLASQQQSFEEKVRNYYQKSYQFGTEYFLSILFSEDNTGDAVRNLAFRQNFIARDKRAITDLVLQIVDLNNSKKKLEENQKQLVNQKASLEVVLAPIRKLVNDARSYQQQLSQTSAGLSSRQQQLLAEKTGNFSTSVGEVPDTQDNNSSIEGFRNNAPSGSFAGFSFGAPHRRGMSQYGAYGRAKDHQSAEVILHAYYNVELKKDYSLGINISVQGYGTYNIEEYVKRIYEVPNSWGDNGGQEALKAQAVAARSYALAYTNNGSGSICATESCQVFQPGNKGGNWERAVKDTQGWVLISGGKPFSAWYSAVSGGYVSPMGWDTKCGSKDCWTNDAYEKIAGAPWFYKAWYKPRYSAATRSNAWLSKDEFVDIVNAVLLYKKDSGTISHLSQTDKSNSDTWSRDEVRNRLGEAINDINSVSVSYSTGGYTSNVRLETDRGGKDINGGDFRQIFNIRAPGEIWL
ncbi:MAG: SpoIID/LytB domain-containing protein, partial [Patescibacteria group bacterium]